MIYWNRVTHCFEGCCVFNNMCYYAPLTSVLQLYMSIDSKGCSFLMVQHSNEQRGLSVQIRPASRRSWTPRLLFSFFPRKKKKNNHPSALRKYCMNINMDANAPWGCLLRRCALMSAHWCLDLWCFSAGRTQILLLLLHGGFTGAFPNVLRAVQNSIMPFALIPHRPACAEPRLSGARRSPWISSSETKTPQKWKSFGVRTTRQVTNMRLNTWFFSCTSTDTYWKGFFCPPSPPLLSCETAVSSTTGVVLLLSDILRAWTPGEDLSRF